MKNFYLYTFFSLFFLINSFAQDSIDSSFQWKSYLMCPDYSYFKIREQTLEYFSQFPDSVISKEKKFFNRADYFLRSRVSSPDSLNSNSIFKYNSAILNNIYQQNICPGTTDNANWQFKGPVIGDHWSGVVISVYSPPNSPNTIFAGTNASGLWKTVDGGNTWSCLTDGLRIPGMGVQCITVDRNNSSNILIGTGISTYSNSYGVGILKWNNDDQEWDVINICGEPTCMPVNKIIQCPAPDSTDVYYAISGSILYRSDDAGLEWDVKKTFEDLPFLSQLNDLEATYDPINDATRLYVTMNDPNTDHGGAILWYNKGTLVDPSWHIINQYLSFGNKNLLSNGDFEETTPDPFQPKWLMTPVGGWTIETLGANHYAQVDFNSITNTTATLTQTFSFLSGSQYSLSFKATVPLNSTLSIIYQGLNPTLIASYSSHNTSLLLDETILLEPQSNYGSLRFIITSDDCQCVFKIDDIILTGAESLYTTNIEGIALDVPDIQSDKIWACYTLGSKLGAYQYIDYTSNPMTDWTNYRQKIKIKPISTPLVFDVLPKPTGDIPYIGGIDFYKVPQTGMLISGNTLHDDIRDFQIIPSSDQSGSDVIIVGNDGGVCRNVGNGFVSINNPNQSYQTGLNITQIYGFDITETQPSSILMGTQDNHSFYYDHSNETWTQIWEGDGGRSFFDYNDYSKYYGLANHLIFDYNNSYYDPDPSTNWKIDPIFIIDPDNSNISYYGRTNVFRNESSCSNTGWAPITGTNTPHKGYVSAIAICPGSNPKKICFADDVPAREEKDANGNPTNEERKRKLYLSENGGSTWRDITCGELSAAIYHAAISDIIFDPTDPLQKTIWVTINGVWSNEYISPPYNGIYRVLVTRDLGETWQDVSQGLPCVPVNKIIYQQGTDEGFYVGTDVGVFYWDKHANNNSGMWQCFCSETFPVEIITDLKINYCERKLYASTFGRGIWVSDLANFSDKDLTINSNVIWEDERTIKSNIVIESGRTLTVSPDAIIKMSANKKIVVKPGGKLIIDGGRITSFCESPWQGIEVWGTANQHQYNVNGICYQGTLILENGGTIENAIEGIVNWKPDDYNSMGGIIQATNANFINNWRAVSFMPYNNFNPSIPSQIMNDLSGFWNCNFETTRNLYNNEPFYSFVTMWKVKGIQFIGCRFSNSNPAASSIYDLGSGITSVDAEYNLNSYCTSSTKPCPEEAIVKNQFSRLMYGINAGKSETNYSYTILNSVFTNCFYGIYNSGVNNPIINKNQFVYDNLYSPITQGVGLFFNTGSGYSIEENSFYSSTSGITTIAAYMVNGGSNANQIYLNTISSFTYGLCSVGQNRSQDGTTGLQFLCNNFSGGKLADIYCKTLSGCNINGGKKNQGDPNLSAGNRFSNIAVGGYNIKNNSGYMMNYYYGSGANEYPTVTTTNVYKYAATTNNSCACSGGGTKASSTTAFAALESTFISEKTMEINYRNQLKALIDGGSTEMLVDLVKHSWPNDTWKLRSALIEKSPFLSEDVLSESAERTSVLPNPILFEIYKLNPEGLSNESIIQYLSIKPNPMSEWMLDSLINTRKIKTFRTILEENISVHASLKHQVGLKIINNILNDTNGIDHYRLQIWLNNLNNYSAEIMAINDYCQIGNYQLAKSILDNIPSKFELSNDEQKEYQTFAELFSYLKSFHNDSIAIYQLDSEQVEKIKLLADDGFGFGKLYAQNICSMYGYRYDPIIEIEDDALTLKSYSIPKQNDPLEQLISIYPSPADSWLAIKWKILPLEDDLIIEIYNSSGMKQTETKINKNEGETVIDIHDWPAGTYFYKINKSVEMIQSGKIVINH